MLRSVFGGKENAFRNLGVGEGKLGRAVVTASVFSRAWHGVEVSPQTVAMVERCWRKFVHRLYQRWGKGGADVVVDGLDGQRSELTLETVRDTARRA